MNNLLRSILFLVVVFSLSSCKKEQPPENEVVRPVKYMVVTDKKTKILRSFPGKVLPNQNSVISFEVPGKVTDITVLKGDQVKKGEMLASLDPSKYQDEVDLADARFNEANAQFNRAEALVKDAYISRSDYDKLKANMEISKAKLSTAKTNLGFTKVYAPYDGLVAKRFVERFDQVKAKQPVLEVQDVGNVDIEIDIPENIVIQFKAMEQGKKQNKEDLPRVYFESLHDVSYPLEFKEFTSEADPNTQTYAVRFTIKQPEDHVILPGMSVTVKAWLPDISGSPDSFHLIPSSAVFSDLDKNPAVWVIDTKNMKVHKRNIEVSKLTDERIRVTAGLHGGDYVVTAGVQFLQENQKVNFFELPNKKNKDQPPMKQTNGAAQPEQGSKKNDIQPNDILPEETTSTNQTEEK